MDELEQIRIKLEPHPLQSEIIESQAKRRVVVSGRRSGKTTLAAMLAITSFAQGQKVLLSSATQDQADIFYAHINKWLWMLYYQKLAHKNDQHRLIEFNGGQIRIKTGSHPDTLRGFDADLLILDECALLDPSVWYAVGLPMLADRDGTAIFISTPRRRNWLYGLYQHAISDLTGRWHAWNFSTMENPHLSHEALAELSADMTDETYRQEILAEFLEGSGQVFRKIHEAAVLQPRTPYPGHFVAGIDLGQRQDATVIAILDHDSHELVYLDRFVGVEWTLQRERIKAIYEAWSPAQVICEINNVGSVIFEDLGRAGLPVIAFSTTQSSKPPLIESLALAFERHEIKIINDPVLIGELESYERTASPVTGRSQYSAPPGLHDDCCIALALAWHGVTHGSTPLVFFA